jgi:AraC-like DNA-binding protein
MMSPHRYALDAGWRPLLTDLGVRPADVLRRAGLPDDLFARQGATLDSAGYFRLWESVEREVDDPRFPILLTQALRGESFYPPLFAALCSPNLRVAATRISRYKPLIAPIRLEIEEADAGLTLRFVWLDTTLAPPPSLIAAELVFFVHLARMATRAPVQPLYVCTTHPPEPAQAYAELFGVPVSSGEVHAIRFADADADRPFLTMNESMWQVFEPDLRRRLAQLDASASVAERVRAALLEGLPAGLGTMEEVARRLTMSKRTLQRRLSEEQTSFQQLLRDTREALARHYLQRTSLAPAEISFLLGFEEPNSFYRAFGAWTGQTPDSVRQSA